MKNSSMRNTIAKMLFPRLGRQERRRKFNELAGALAAGAVIAVAIAAAIILRQDK